MRPFTVEPRYIELAYIEFLARPTQCYDGDPSIRYIELRLYRSYLSGP